MHFCFGVCACVCACVMGGVPHTVAQACLELTM